MPIQSLLPPQQQQQQQKQAMTALIYEFVESRTLPTLDLSRSFGSIFCSRKQQHSSSNAVTPIMTAAVSASAPGPSDPQQARSASLPWQAKVGMAGYIAGVALSAIVFCVPATVGRPLAIIGVVISIPGTISALSQIRYDVARLLFVSYEFYYFIAVNSTVCVLSGALLGDVRAIQCAMQWIALLNGALVDAKILNIRQSVRSSSINVVAHCVMLVAVQFGLVDRAQHVAVLAYRNHTLAADDVIVNGLATLTVLLLRNAVRRIQDLRQQQRVQCTMLRCVTYRCTIQMRALTPRTLANVARGANRRDVKKGKCITNKLVFVDNGALFDARKTFVALDLYSATTAAWLQQLLAALGALSIALVVGGFAAHASGSDDALALFSAGLVGTTSVCGGLWSVSQYDVLWEVLTSFDVVFVSFQLSLAHVCVCDLYAWDVRCLGIMSSWLWMHAVLTSDALTPVVRLKLGMRKAHVVVPLLVFTVAQVLLVYVIVLVDTTDDNNNSDRWSDVYDRQIHAITVDRNSKRVIAISVVTFLFNRLVTVFCWCLRLLYRVAIAAPDDVLLLRGKVAYSYLHETAEAPPPTAAAADTTTANDSSSNTNEFTQRATSDQQQSDKVDAASPAAPLTTR